MRSQADITKRVPASTCPLTGGRTGRCKSSQEAHSSKGNKTPIPAGRGKDVFISADRITYNFSSQRAEEAIAGRKTSGGVRQEV